MKIMKRSGIEADFDVTKISAAIKKANCEVAAVDQLSEEQIEEISTNVEKICSDIGRTLGVEEIQDLVEDQIMNQTCICVGTQIHYLPLYSRLNPQIQLNR